VLLFLLLFCKDDRVGFLPILQLVPTCFLSGNIKEEEKLDPPPFALSLSLSPTLLPLCPFLQREMIGGAESQ